MNNDLKNKVKYKISMYNFIEERKKEKEVFNYKKLVYICLALFLTIGTAVGAKSLIRLFGLNAPDGVNVAVENGYIENVNTKYQTLNNDIKIKVSSFLIDKFNLDINFEIDSLIYDLNHGFNFNDLTISDEKGNFIFSSKKHNLSYSVTGSDNMVHLTIFADDMPSIKSLNISFSDIIINNKNVKGSKVSYTLDVPETMQSRETIKYVASSSNIANANFESAVMSNTALKVKFSNGNSNYKLLENNKDIWDISNISDNAYVELNDGTKIDLARRNDSGGVTIRNNTIEYEYNFNLTKFQACNNFKLHIGDMVINYTRVDK